jgi:tetratricopeptide (TPR) repeat protein
MTEAGANRQTASGSYIAEAGPGAVAKVTVNNVYQQAAPAPVGDAERAAAMARLVDLPVDGVPPPAALPSGSRMPFARNALFVGREGDLKILAAALKAGGTAAVGQIAAATGLGGIGKTQLANEFVHRYGQYFAGGVFWLNFADPNVISGEIAACGGSGALDLRPDFANLPLPDQVRLVASAWHGPLPRLLIFDNCEDEDLLAQWRPVTGGSRVLVTSRRGVWRGDLGVQALRLGVLSRSESIDLLRGHRPDLLPDDQDLAAIADELGDLPLALHLAGSFLARYRHAPFGTPASYLAQLRRADLLEHRSMTAGGRSPTGHEQHVARSFALSYERLNPADGIDALALSLLARATCFGAGEPIPRELLRASLNLPGEDESAALQSEDAMGRLIGLGLVEQDDHGRLVLHRLLAGFVRGETAAPDLTAARLAVEEAVLAEASRLNEAGYPAPLLAWQPHLRTVAENAAAADSEQAGDLQNALGVHLQMVAEYRDARTALERALAIDERAYDAGHRKLAIRVRNLGGVLHDLGDLAGARAAFERSLAIDEKAYGPDHPEVATDVRHLGGVLHDLGDLACARAAFERSLAIDEKAYGPDHPEVAIDVTNLGSVLQDLGDLSGAHAAYQRSLAIDEKAYGPDHPDVAADINNLGSVLQDLGDLVGARKAFERALTIDERVLGSDHPDVATDLINSGSVLRALGDLAGALAACERALAIDERAYGPDHPNIATDVNNLGSVLQARGDLAGARAAYERALDIDKKALGPDHPSIAIRLDSLGTILQDIGDLAGARAAYEQALSIGERVLGKEDARVLDLRRKLANLQQLNSQGVMPMEPILTTALLSALAAGAAKGVTAVSEKAITEAYNAVKALLIQKFGPKSGLVDAVERVEANPESAGRKQTLQEEADAAKADQDAEIVAAARALLSRVKALPDGEQHIQNVQKAVGNYIAQAGPGATAKVNVSGVKGKDD